MVIGSNRKIKIANSNKHLKDIFSSSIYLELGNINYIVMERLLSYEMINIDEITDYRIQNNGVGKFEIKDTLLQSYLPFAFFENLNRKNRSLQIILTYGIVKLRNEENKEIFAPLILIPVNIYFQDKKVFIQKISRPVENSVLLSELPKLLSPEQRKQLPTSDKFDTLYSLDKYCLAVNNIPGISITLENYLTTAFVKEKEIKIDHQKFPMNRNIDDFLRNKYYQERFRNYYFLNPLNKKQREALSNALAGNNFVLVGRMGTGKTTTLINIAINAINRGKRVLYVSNMKETLDYVYKFFEDRKFENYIANLSNSFSTLLYGEVETYNKGSLITSDNLHNLYKNYKYINDFESFNYSRILDFRFVEVVSKIALIDKNAQILEIDDLSDLYKSEYLEVIKALGVIEEYRKKIDSIKDSIWKDIPIQNKIKDKKEIINLVKELHRLFTILESEKYVLENEFGLSEITNLALLKNRIREIKRLTIHDIPLSWKEETFETFKEANNEYKNLKGKIYQLQEIEYFLIYRYNKIESIDINKEIEIVLDKYFTTSDFEKINNIIKNRYLITISMERGALQKEIFLKSLSKLRKFLGWNIGIDDNSLKELLKLSDYILNNHYTYRILEIINKNKYESIKSEVLNISSEIKEYRERIEKFRFDYPNADIVYINDYCNILNKYPNISKEEMKLINPLFTKSMKKDIMKYIDKVTNEIAYYNDAVLKLHTLEEQYFKISGYNDSDYDLFINDIDKLNDYLKSISESNIKNKIYKFLDKLSHNFSKAQIDNNRIVIKTFSLFNKAYEELNKDFVMLDEYSLIDNNKSFEDKLFLFDNINKYLDNLYSSNDRMNAIIRNNDEEYVKFDEYINIRDQQIKVKELKEELNNNELYLRLFENLYKASDTNINIISRYLQNFSSYIECFKNGKELIKSFDDEVNPKLISHLDRCLEVSTEINQLFKLYTKIFKDVVTRYYYFDFKNAITYFASLLKSSEELKNYLVITKNMQVLIKYNLTKFINYILNLTSDSSLVDDFKLTYLENLRKLFFEKYPDLDNVKNVESCLKTIVELEQKIIDENENNVIYNIKKNSGGKFYVNDIRNLDYKSYIRRTYGTKHLFLTTSQVLNNYLDIDSFDLIIIDDAHLLNANEYYKAIEGKQVIISGELQLQSVVSSNLISRMRYNSVIHLNYRFLPTPKKLLNHMNGLFGPIKKRYSENYGIEAITDKILEYICLLFRENKDYIVNLFVSSATKQKVIYEQLANILLSYGFKNNEIIDIFNYKLNISDLLDSYLYDADFNVIYLEDYYDVNIEYISVNMIDNLLLCKNRIIVYDSRGYLASSKGSFVEKIRDILYDNSDLFKGVIINPVINKLANILIEKKLEVFPTHDDLSLVIKKQDKLYGILFFFDYVNNRYEILNDYRDYYHYFMKNDIKIIITWLVDTAKSIEEVANYIIKEIEND